jgi:ribosomal protein S27E
MESSTKVKCNNCLSYVIPRLIHHQHHANLVVNRKTEHVCPICGETMYETGGKLTGLGRVWLYFLMLVMTLILISNYDKNNSNLMYYVVIGLVVVIWIKKRNRS